MLYEILTQCISVIGTIISVLFIRWLMELSSPMEDLLTIERFLYRETNRWKSGTFESLIIWHRFTKLMRDVTFEQ